MMKNMKTIALIEDGLVENIVHTIAKNCTHSIASGTAFYCNDDLVVVLKGNQRGIVGNKIPRRVCLSMCEIRQKNNNSPYNMQKISEQLGSLDYKDLIITNDNMLTDYMDKDLQEYLYFVNKNVLRDIVPLEISNKTKQQLKMKRSLKGNWFSQNSMIA